VVFGTSFVPWKKLAFIRLHEGDPVRIRSSGISYDISAAAKTTNVRDYLEARCTPPTDIRSPIVEIQIPADWETPNFQPPASKPG
jgi:hypothetical protein